MISIRSLAKPPRKKTTIDVKASVSCNTTFQHPKTLESDSDKWVSSVWTQLDASCFIPSANCTSSTQWQGIGSSSRHSTLQRRNEKDSFSAFSYLNTKIALSLSFSVSGLPKGLPFPSGHQRTAGWTSVHQKWSVDLLYNKNYIKTFLKRRFLGLAET